MQNLLDHFAPTANSIRATSVSDVFALRLAQKLGDAPVARHYLDLTADHSEMQLVAAYRSALRASGHGDLGRRFHVELRRTRSEPEGESSSRLIAIRVERRTVAIAVFHGTHLEYVDARQLSSNHGKAESSAVGFIRWILSRFAIESAALESIPDKREILRRILHEAICANLRDQMLSVWEIPREVLLGSYGYPPLRSREQLRQVAVSIWPILAGNHARVFMQDAAILGLHVQTERIFIIDQDLS